MRTMLPRSIAIAAARRTSLSSQGAARLLSSKKKACMPRARDICKFLLALRRSMSEGRAISLTISSSPASAAIICASGLEMINIASSSIFGPRILSISILSSALAALGAANNANRAKEHKIFLIPFNVVATTSL